MRKTPLILIVVVFALWLSWKGLHFLDTAPAEIYSTPTVQPTNAAELGELPLKRHQRACADAIEYGPGAHYVAVTVLTSRPAGRLRFEARAPGYAADAIYPAGAGNNQQIVVPITPAAKPVDGGTLCITNLGKHRVGFYSVGADGLQGTPSQTTVDGKATSLDLSITLLTSPSKSLGSRLGTLFDHMAAFNPLSDWAVWVLFLLALIGVPVALGVALGRAAAQDDAGDEPAGPTAEPQPRGGW